MDIHEVFNSVVRSGDGVLDYVRVHVAMSGRNPDEVKEVEMSPLPASLAEKLKHRVFLKACYHNTMEAIKFSRKKDVRYVLGYWHHIIPVEHCFLKIGDVYYDPTGELLFDYEEPARYFVDVELHPADVKLCGAYMRKMHRGFRDHIGVFEWNRYRQEVLCGG